MGEGRGFKGSDAHILPFIRVGGGGASRFHQILIITKKKQ